ncbi:MAG TPA: NAD-binding protein [Prosthecobacter sp.]|nr:NAD-binding protein [Prosthecobacter sp.]HRK16634.1 NAD-binding protein [Prosthecobacter sp.]
MKALLAVLNPVMENRTSRTNLRALANLILVLAGLVAVFSLLFHVLMVREGQEHSWITGLYWTLTVMTTLGFGDITFQGDLGRLFSVVVLCSGVVFMLVLLPFTFIEFFYAPWMRAQAAAKAPRELPASTSGHVILTDHGPLATTLIPMLEKYGHPYVVLCPTLQEALDLDERGVRVAVGDLDDPETYRRMRVEQAAMLVATRADVINTNATFTARELAERVPIVASASSDSARDVLELAGATLVLRLEEMMGSALARRVSIRDSDAHVIGNLDGLLIAEAAAHGTPLAGQTLAQSGLRTRTGVSVIGVWDHGRLAVAEADMMIRTDTIFVLAGTREQLDRYNAAFPNDTTSKPRVLIIGGGRVGRATSRVLRDLGIQTTIIEKIPERVAGHPEAVIGDATQMDVLKKAAAREATTLIITTHDDDTNVALTIFFRRLRSNWQILARSTLDRNLKTLLRAGADLVLSYSSMGANTVFNLLRGGDHLLLAEGVNVFPSPIPESVAGRRLGELEIRSQTGCTVIAVESRGKREINPGPELLMPAGGRMFLIGTLEAEEKFLELHKPAQPLKRGRRH